MYPTVKRTVRWLVTGVVMTFSYFVHAENLSLSDEVFYTDVPPHSSAQDYEVPSVAYFDFWIEWDAAWRNRRNHDAVWIFAKVLGGDASGFPLARHANVGGVPEVLFIDRSTGDAALEFIVPADKTGVFVQLQSAYRGSVRAKLRIPVDADVLKGLNTESRRASVHGIEMVYIPEGAFYAGGASEESIDYGAYFRSGADGEFDGPLRIVSEDQIDIGDGEGQLYFRSDAAPQFMGIAAGTIPDTFPKGFSPFYVMKYEISQGEYATFLNKLDVYGADFRANFAGPTYYEDRGTISFTNGAYVAASPKRPANFVSWEDGIAFLDWAALRPMTDLEYTKAARGTAEPPQTTYVWGNSSTAAVQRSILPNGDLGMLDGSSEATLTDDTREKFAASFYWVMDLSGSLWERVVTLSDAEGRKYTGTHGDGQVTAWGEANVDSWPRELGGPRRGKGFGYRGGGYYSPDTEYSRYNPHSPVSFRPFGNWSGGPRYRAYGFRGVRSAHSESIN